jgi:hypothetical protein
VATGRSFAWYLSLLVTLLQAILAHYEQETRIKVE